MTDASRWRPAGGIILEPNGLTAARLQTGNLAVTAGPGAGKTEVLAQRADFLLSTGLCFYPSRILAISFKVDAAANLLQRVALRCGPELAARLDSQTFHAFAKRIIDMFRPVLTGQDALDPDYKIGKPRVFRRQIEFSDLVPLATQILQTSAVARHVVRQTYSDVFLDEFQDCTREQYSLIQLAFGIGAIRLTAVGDNKQKIMGFAGALEGIFLEFARDFGAAPLTLYQNFRSLPRLRRMQNAMVRVMEPAAALADEQIVGVGGEIAVVRYANPVEEAKGIAARIETWLGSGVPPSEIAVLVTRQIDLYGVALKVELDAKSITYRDDHELQELVKQPMAATVIDIVSCAVHANSPDAYSRLLDLIDAQDYSENQAYRLRSDVNAFIDSKGAMLAKDPTLSTNGTFVVDLIDEFVSSFPRPLLTSLSPDYESGTRLQDLVDAVKGYFRDRISAGASVYSALMQLSGGDSVKIMTVHKSKGLEFRKVVMMAVEHETYFSTPTEERSNFFVGISRAKESLVLTYVDQRPKPVGAKRWSPIRTGHAEFLGYAWPYSGC